MKHRFSHPHLGGGLGLAAAFLGTRLLRRLLVGVSTADIPIYVGSTSIPQLRKST
jgi:hypothetical protein